MSNKIKLLCTGGTFLSSEKNGVRKVEEESTNKNRNILTKITKDLGYLIDEESVYTIDSSDLEPKDWKKIVNTINNLEQNSNYMGYALIHGTDTMEYSSSALSFLLEGLKKPLIITGSMISIENKNSDAPNNLISTLKGVQELSNFSKNGVYVGFGDKLLQGNKVKKMDSNDFSTFDTPGYPNIGEYVGDVNNKKLLFDQNQLEKYTSSLKKEGINNFNLEKDVELIKLFPGKQINAKELLQKKIKGVVLEGYGDGNVPSTRKFVGV